MVDWVSGDGWGCSEEVGGLFEHCWYVCRDGYCCLAMVCLICTLLYAVERANWNGVVGGDAVICTRVARAGSFRIETPRESMRLPLLSDMHQEMGLEYGSQTKWKSGDAWGWQSRWSWGVRFHG